MKAQAKLFIIGVLILAAFLLSPGPAPAQVSFSNVSPSVDAPISAYPSGTLLSGSNYLAGLYGRRVDSSPDSSQLVSSVQEFGTGDSAGYISGRSGGAVPGVGPGQVAIFEVRVWSAAGGRTYEEAVLSKLTNSAIAYGKSESIAVKVGGVTHPACSCPPFSAPLYGLRGFSIK